MIASPATINRSDLKGESALHIIRCSEGQAVLRTNRGLPLARSARLLTDGSAGHARSLGYACGDDTEVQVA